MSTALTFCPTCGLSPAPAPGLACPRCTQGSPGLWGSVAAFLVWGSSVGFLIVAQVIATVIYFAARYLISGVRPELALTPPLALTWLAATFVAHLLTFALSWVIVTGYGRRPFFATLGWRWHTQFKWVHAVALALGMLLLAFLFERTLPHGETDLERLLRLSTSVRVAVALLAMLTAPLVEEVVYRGVLYGAIERARGPRAAVVIIALLFALVHVPQYWGSWAAIAAVLSLSIVLTLLRAATHQLLPCVATHFVFNGIQAVILLASPPTREPVREALASLLGGG
jgi:membrane protease YdiL (CAAX protease family)